MRTASMPEYPEAPTTATLTLSFVATWGISMLLASRCRNYTVIMIEHIETSLLGLELEDHFGWRMVGVGGEFV
jgi:hypothetical protein